MAEPLRGVVKRDIVMAARQNGIEKQRVNIGFEIPAVHLNAKFIAKHQRNGQCIMLVII